MLPLHLDSGALVKGVGNSSLKRDIEAPQVREQEG